MISVFTTTSFCVYVRAGHSAPLHRHLDETTLSVAVAFDPKYHVLQSTTYVYFYHCTLQTAFLTSSLLVFHSVFYMMVLVLRVLLFLGLNQLRNLEPQ